MAASGASSRSMRSTRSGFAITRGASRSSAFSQSPQGCDSRPVRHLGEDRLAQTIAAPAVARDRASGARTRDASGSSELASRTRRSYSCSRPLSRRCQRSSRPITAASTIRSSQRHGARSVPARSRSVSPRSVAACGFFLRLHVLGAFVRRQHRLDEFFGRRRPQVRVAGVGERHLAQRHVFRKSPRRQFFVGAGQQREQRPAGRIGTPRAAMEPRGNAGAIERVLEHAKVGLRRAQQHRHLIERHAALGFLQAGVARSRPLRGLRPARRTARPIRPVRRSAADRSKTGSAADDSARVQRVHRVHRVHRVQRVHQVHPSCLMRSVCASPEGTVAITAAAAAITACANASSALRANRDVEQDHGLVGEERRVRVQFRRGGREHGRVVNRAGLAPLVNRALEQRGEIGVRGVAVQTRPVRAPAMRSSPNVRLSARGNPGMSATGAKYPSPSRLSRSSATRAATASSLSGAVGVSPRFARAGKARRATSSATLDRVMPNVAPVSAAIDRANSSAAERLAPITSIGGSSASTARARRQDVRRWPRRRWT